MKNIVAICVGACIMFFIILGTIIIAKESIKLSNKYNAAGEYMKINSQDLNSIYKYSK